MREISDPLLVSKVRKYGVFNAQGCFGCGSCTIVCDLTTDSASFPRRTMQSAVLGLNDSMVQGLEPWLCHDCGDCSTTCPRQAEPRQSMMTLRRYLAAQYEWTGLSSRISRSPAWEITALSSVAGMVLALIILYHLYIEHLDISFVRTSMGLEHMFPRIGYFTIAVFLIPGALVLGNALRMFRLTMRRGANRAIPLRSYLAEAKVLFLNMTAHLQFLKCAAKDRKKRWTTHWLLAFGCVLMAAIKFFFLKWFQTDHIYPLYHPQRWLGYLAAACLIIGAADILAGRMRKGEETRRPAKWGDVILPVLLLLTALSGMAVHIFRYTGLTLAAHYTYAVHLMIVVPMLVVEVPFGQWSHMIYRPMALYFAAVRARALEEQKAREALAA